MKVADQSARTPYEQEQLAAIHAWKSEQPSIAGRALIKLLAPAVFVVDRMVPPAAMEGIIEHARWAGQKMTDTQDVLKEAGVDDVEALRTMPLERCDALANSAQRWAIGLAAGEGAATGAAGFVGIALDIPAALALAFRTIYKTGVCYGYKPDEIPHELVHGILAASGANSMQEKLAALAYLQALRTALHQQSWRMLATRAAEHTFSREGAIIAARSLAKQLGINLTKRKALQAIPVIGAVVGASVNGWYMRDVAISARRAFQERWLLEREAITTQGEA